MNRKETMLMTIVGMAVLTTVTTMSSSTQALALGHWNIDEDYIPNSGFAVDGMDGSGTSDKSNGDDEDNDGDSTTATTTDDEQGSEDNSNDCNEMDNESTSIESTDDGNEDENEMTEDASTDDAENTDEEEDEE